MGSKIFRNVGGLKPGRSVFNLSYTKLFTADLGLLYPVMHDEMVPGDTFVIGNEIVVRMMPMVTPILHEINAYVHYFFVPYRLLWPEAAGPVGWQTFITGGILGTDTPTLPRWSPTTYTEGSLWDYLGFPVGISPTGALPIKFPMNAYNMIYNEYYRDETLIAAISLDTEVIQKRAWDKDYFTSSLPWQQKGTAPALPISGSAVFAASIGVASASSGGSIRITAGSTSVFAASAAGSGGSDVYEARKANLDSNTLTTATFNISDLRLTTQIQKFLERNARVGSRHVEFIRAHFGPTGLRDDRLQRPEYIGGSKSPIIVSEVLQTSSSTIAASTPQGTMAGHGLTADQNHICKYTAPEFGIVMGILSVMPKPMYSQGINKQWLRTTKYDFYFPEFAHLSEQAILRAEIFANAVSGDNNTVFGYQGRYDEMRIKHNLVCGKMRYGGAAPFPQWHLAREFATYPTLNQTFIECVPRKTYLASASDPAMVVHFANIIKAIRPMPMESQPGLMDHF